MVAVGVVGLGYWGPNVSRNVSASPRTTLAALCDSNPVRVGAVAAQYPAAATASDPQDLYSSDGVDAIWLATPVSTHYSLARDALRAGKHVVVEKPFTETAAQAEELVDLAAELDRVLLVDHVFLYSPAVLKLAELTASGELGDLHFIDSVRINLGLFQHDVNVVWDLAPHDLSIIDHLVGRSPESLVALGASHARNGLVNVAYLHLDFGDDVLASVHVNWLSPVKIRHFMVGGSRRSVLYNDLDPSERVKVYDRGIDVAEDPEGMREALISYRSGDVVSPRIENVEPLRNLVEHFADCIEKGETPRSGGEQGHRLVRVLEAADQSIEGGGSVVRLSADA